MDGSREVCLVVQQDNRSFEQRRSEQLNCLEQMYTSAQNVPVARTASRSNSRSCTPSGCQKPQNDWACQVSKWVKECQKQFSEDNVRAWQNMFALVPTDECDPNNWDNFRLSKPNAFSVFKPQGSCPMVNRTQSLCRKESQPCGQSQRDDFEIAEDGQLYFKACFCVKDFEAKDITVSVKDCKLKVQAQKCVMVCDQPQMKSFCRVIDLPRGVQFDKMCCSITCDGVLILTAPVCQQENMCFTFDHQRQIGIMPQSGHSLQVLCQPGLSIQSDACGNRRIHIELDVGPNFRADQICVRASGCIIYISGKREARAPVAGTCDSRCTSDEFTRAFEVPSPVDPLTVRAQLINGILIVEAPLC